ncbi:MAG: transposase [Caulobacteraceae bacterium]|nr:transposase [Caulobacteraceae bacterium]
MSHMTLMTGPERRRRWSEDIREQILAAAFSPGVVVADVARQFEVSTSLIYKWRRAYLAAPEPMGFAPAVLVSGPEPCGAPSVGPAIMVELPGGARVSVMAGAATALVAATLKALR